MYKNPGSELEGKAELGGKGMNSPGSRSGETVSCSRKNCKELVGQDCLKLGDPTEQKAHVVVPE